MSQLIEDLKVLIQNTSAASDHTVVPKFDLFRVVNMAETLQGRVTDLTVELDNQLGSPCAQIAWEQERAELKELLGVCQEQFMFYAESHVAKDTVEADQKAMVNLYLAQKIGELLED